MATKPDNPCRDGHPELALLLEVTAFDERHPLYLCDRCGSRLGFEEAVRNDERLRIAARIAELERQRDQVMAIVGREPIDARRAYADIRRVLDGEA